VKAYRLELLVIDFENHGKEEIEMLAMNARGLDPTVISIEGRDIGEWTDDHPLNRKSTAEAEFKRLFTPSSTPTAGGERQSIDTPEFRALLSDLFAAYNSGVNVVMRERALIAYIDTWAGRSAGDAVPANVLIDAVNMMLWLYRRLPRAYDRPPFVEKSITDLAKIVGVEVCEYFNERGAAPTNTAPAVQPESIDKRTDAEVLRALTKEYDAYMADRAALVMGQSFTEWKDGRMRQGQNSANESAEGGGNAQR
jgi:hypothetical protein